MSFWHDLWYDFWNKKEIPSIPKESIRKKIKMVPPNEVDAYMEKIIRKVNKISNDTELSGSEYLANRYLNNRFNLANMTGSWCSGGAYSNKSKGK